MEHDISKVYTITNGFAFTAISYPFNVHDAIIVKCKGVSDCEVPQYDIPDHTIEDYVIFINKMKIQKAVIILNNIACINMCPSLKYIQIIPSYQADASFVFSPLYEMPEIKLLSCQNRYGSREQFISEVDYSRIRGLISLSINVNRKTLNYNMIETLKSLDVGGFKGKNHDLTDLFSSEKLDTLRLIQCGMYSLNGIETSRKMQCLYLHYNRSLQDISALRKVKGTLKALRIENCPKIEDFSVLGELENLELLELSGNNVLPNLNFLKTMKNLKTLIFNMNVLCGDLSPCLDLCYVYSEKNRKHYNLQDEDLPKKKYVRGNEGIDEWRRLE